MIGIFCKRALYKRLEHLYLWLSLNLSLLTASPSLWLSLNMRRDSRHMLQWLVSHVEDSCWRANMLPCFALHVVDSTWVFNMSLQHESETWVFWDMTRTLVTRWRLMLTRVTCCRDSHHVLKTQVESSTWVFWDVTSITCCRDSRHMLKTHVDSCHMLPWFAWHVEDSTWVFNTSLQHVFWDVTRVTCSLTHVTDIRFFVCGMSHVSENSLSCDVSHVSENSLHEFSETAQWVLRDVTHVTDGSTSSPRRDSCHRRLSEFSETWTQS